MENKNQNSPDEQNQKSGGLILKKTTPALLALLALAIIAILGIYANSYMASKHQPANTGNSKSSDVKMENVDDYGQIFNPGEALKNMGNIRGKFYFPKYDYKKSDYKPSIPDQEIALSELKNLANFQKKTDGSPLNPIIFSDSEKRALERNNFFVALNSDDFFNKDPKSGTMRIDDWTDLYGKIGGPGNPLYRAPENSVFVSSDFLLHVYHKLLEKEFEYIEQKEFYPRLKKITYTMLNASIGAYNNSDSAGDKESYQRLIVYFAVPDAIINSSHDFYKNETVADDNSDSKEAVFANLGKIKNRIPSASYGLAERELELVMAAKDREVSPLFGKYQEEQGLSFEEDYTQYGPRSHYGKNPVLRSYFRAMMWYGRQNFLAKSPELTRDAVNIVLMMNQLDLVKDWEDIYIPTAFFVGESDDLGIYEYQKALADNKNFLVGDELVAKIQDEIMKLKNPEVMSSLIIGDAVLDVTKEELQNKTKGFRFMGQRFTPDAFIFSSLTQGDEKADPKTSEKLPSMPTALMVMSALGNKTADGELGKWVSSDAPDSKNIIADRLSALKKSFGGLTQDVWTQNIYWGWLYALKSLSQENMDKNGYPGFMKNGEWDKKNLQASLGSWTELKHDTLLYAKQSYAELGGGGDEGKIPAVPKSYVEPNIEFFDRLIPLAKMTREGLEQRNLLPQEFQGRNDRFGESLEFFRKIAIAELNNEKISDSDFERLRLEAGQLSWAVAPLPSEDRTEDLARSALIADVHTDGLKNRILYEADGIPNYIYVAVKDVNGARLTKGLLYSYYEFTNPLEKRLTDTDWKERVYSRDSSRMPSLPEWSGSLIK